MTRSGGFIGGRFTRLLTRRPALFHFVVAIVAARIVFSVLDLVEAQLSGYSLLITVLLLVEVVIVWRRIGPHRGRAHEPRVGAEGATMDRFLRLTERFGAVAVYVVTGLTLVAELVLALRGASRTTLIDVTSAIRWVELGVLLVVILVARNWDQRFPERVGPPESPPKLPPPPAVPPVPPFPPGQPPPPMPPSPPEP